MPHRATSVVKRRTVNGTKVKTTKTSVIRKSNPKPTTPSKKKSVAEKKAAFANISKNITKGGLRKSLGTPQGKKIPLGQIRAAAKKPGLVGKQARLALVFNRLRPRKKK